jgi:hypothetical protein
MIFSKSHCPDSHLHSKDARLAYLLILLGQIDHFTPQLDALPEPELSEIVSAAIRVSGFVEPCEAHHVIVAVLEALETRDPIPKHWPSAVNGAPLS